MFRIFALLSVRPGLTFCGCAEPRSALGGSGFRIGLRIGCCAGPRRASIGVWLDLIACLCLRGVQRIKATATLLAALLPATEHHVSIPMVALR